MATTYTDHQIRTKRIPYSNPSSTKCDYTSLGAMDSLTPAEVTMGSFATFCLPSLPLTDFSQ